MNTQTKTIKCIYCGKVLLLTKNGKRPRQHVNGKRTCLGSGQTIDVHNSIREYAQKNATNASAIFR